MKKLANLLFLLSLIACLCSCNAQKRWTERGVRKHWLDTTVQEKTGMVKIDTVELAGIVDTFFQTIDNDIYHPCDEQAKLTPTAKKQMANKAKKKLVPALQKQFMIPLRDINLEGGGHLSFWYDSTKAQIDYKLLMPGQRTICPDITFNEACKKVWWLLLISPFLGILILMVILYFIKK